MQLSIIFISDFLAKFVRKAWKKPQKPDEENVIPDDAATDTEQQENLPEDKEIQEPGIKDIEEEDTYYIEEQKTKSIKTTSITKKYEERRRSSTKSTKSSSSKDMRQDSISSNWSDNIPVIKISKTESTECILESAPTKRDKKITHQEHIDVEKEENLPSPQPQCSTSSSETLVTIKMDDSDYEINVEINDAIKEIEAAGKMFENKNRLISADGTIDPQKCNSDNNSQKVSESSADYQE